MKPIMLFSLLLFSILITLLLYSFSANATKPECQKYRKKLDNIHAQQRQASTLKRSNSLAKREDKARDTWWRCQNGKLKAKPKKSAKKKKSSVKRVKLKKLKKLKGMRAERNSEYQAFVPVANNNPVAGGTVYQGEKLQAWLTFYQADKKCTRPKSTQEFVACAEDKRRQRAKFEKTYTDH
ncbi:MAG: hypothetical protein ACPG52_10455 [Cognaticolwellia sp.]